MKRHLALVLWLLLRAVMEVSAHDGKAPPGASADQGQAKDPADSGQNTGAAKAKSSNPLEGIKIGGLWYISFQDGQAFSGSPGETSRYSQFRVKRGYINITKEIQPWLEVRFTPDVHQDSSGDYRLRMKYVYAKLKWQGNNFISKPYAEFGIVHMPWLDFEEHVNRFRLQDTMFMERNGLFNSADVGVTLGSNFGPDLSNEYKENVDDHYAGRYGSWQLGVYNGGGYHASEKNRDKVLEGRATLRPLPDSAPGLQFSFFGVQGKGNAEKPPWPDKLPNYQVLAGMVSYEHAYFVLTGQWYGGEGNGAGSAVLPGGLESRSQGGSAYFAEVRLNRARSLSLIGRYDRFDFNREDARSDLQERVIAGFAWQMFKHNYWVFDYERLLHSNSDIPAEGRVQVTLQLSF